MKKDCLQCGKEYEAKRSSSKFCGATRRSLFRYHKVSVQDKLLSVQKNEVSVQKEVSVQDSVTSEQPETKEKKIPLFCPKHKGANARYCGCY